MKLKFLEKPKFWPFHSSSASILYKTNEILVLSVVGTICKFWLRVVNTTQTENLKTLADIVLGRKFGDRPLLTVSNHQSCVDDPVLLGLLPFRILLHPRRIRWIPGADEVMFYNERSAKFFGLGRVVPTIRGWGVYQKSVDYCLEKLNQGNRLWK